MRLNNYFDDCDCNESEIFYIEDDNEIEKQFEDLFSFLHDEDTYLDNYTHTYGISCPLYTEYNKLNRLGKKK